MTMREVDMDMHIVICLHIALHFILILIHAYKYSISFKKLNTQWYLFIFFSLPIVQTLEIFPFRESIFHSKPFYLWIYSELELLKRVFLFCWIL